MEYADIEVKDFTVVERRDDIALIDADTIAYIGCGIAEKKLGAIEMFTTEEIDEALKVGGVVWEGELVISDLQEAIDAAYRKVDKILELTGCSKQELHFTLGRENFRYKLYENYKANRIGRTPLYLIEVKEALVKKYGGQLHTEIEADDAIVYLKRKYPNKYLVCAIDKDVLRALPGKHFNYYESAQYNISMKFVETSEEEARLFPYRQAMIGDKSDNIYGIARVGEKTAKKLIPDGCENPREVLISNFINAGLTEEDAIRNLELTYMGPEDICKQYVKDAND